MSSDPTFIYRSLTPLHPEFRARITTLHKVIALLHETGSLQFRAELFETYRSPERQEKLFADKVTRARGGQSPHNYGLAADFVPFLTQAQGQALNVRAGWYWPPLTDPFWKVFKKAATACGLVTIAWDGPHVEYPFWKAHRGWKMKD